MYPRSIRVITREARTAALAAQELVWHPLCNGSRQGGVSHAPLSGDRTGTLPLGKTLASNAPLQIGQLGLAPHVDPRLRAAARPSLARLTIRWRSSSARALRKAMKPRPMGVVRSKCGLSSTFSRTIQANARTSAPNSPRFAVTSHALDHGRA